MVTDQAMVTEKARYNQLIHHHISVTGAAEAKPTITLQHVLLRQRDISRQGSKDD